MGKVNFSIQNAILLIHNMLSICYVYAMPLLTRKTQTLCQTLLNSILGLAYAKYMLSRCSPYLQQQQGQPSPKLSWHSYLFSVSLAYAEQVQNLLALVLGNLGFLAAGAIEYQLSICKASAELTSTQSKRFKGLSLLQSQQSKLSMQLAYAYAMLSLFLPCKNC